MFFSDGASVPLGPFCFLSFFSGCGCFMFGKVSEHAITELQHGDIHALQIVVYNRPLERDHEGICQEPPH